MFCYIANYKFKVNNDNEKAEINTNFFFKLTEQRQYCYYYVFIGYFEQSSQFTQSASLINFEHLNITWDILKS